MGGVMQNMSPQGMTSKRSPNKIVHPESEAAKASASAKNFEVEMKSTESYLLKDREIYS